MRVLEARLASVVPAAQLALVVLLALVVQLAPAAQQAPGEPEGWGVRVVSVALEVWPVLAAALALVVLPGLGAVLAPVVWAAGQVNQVNSPRLRTISDLKDRTVLISTQLGLSS